MGRCPPPLPHGTAPPPFSSQPNQILLPPTLAQLASSFSQSSFSLVLSLVLPTGHLSSPTFGPSSNYHSPACHHLSRALLVPAFVSNRADAGCLHLLHLLPTPRQETTPIRLYFTHVAASLSLQIHFSRPRVAPPEPIKRIPFLPFLVFHSFPKLSTLKNCPVAARR